MNTKLLLHLGMLCFAATAQLFGCTITLVNDLATPINIILADKTVIRVIAGDETTFGQSNQLAQFTVLKQVQGKTFKYNLSQTSCSPSHQIDLYASMIGNGPIEYFDVSNNLNSNPSGGCGCGHKDRPR